MPDHLDPKTLESGRVLLALKSMFNENRCTETLFPFLECLRDSVVYVPMNAILSEEDQKRTQNLKAGDRWSNNDEIRFTPDTLRSPDGKLWFPIFTQVEQIPEDYRKRFSIISLPALRCLSMAHAIRDVEGFVVDAFTDATVLTFALADILKAIPSKIDTDTQSHSTDSLAP